MFEKLNDRMLCESVWGAAGEGSAFDEMYLCFLELFFCSSWRTSQYDSNLLGLDFLICLNLVVSTMNNRTQFQWWFLRGGIPKIKLCNCPLQKYSNSLSIWYEFDRFPLCPVFPYPTFSLLFREMQFSHCDSLFDLDFLFPLCLCQLKHASGCAYDIFSEIHCVRDGDRLPHCFSCLLSSLLYNPTLSLLWSLCVWHFLKRSFIHLGYFNV